MTRILVLVFLLASPPARAVVDWTRPPATGPMRAVKLPPRQEWRLKNGMTVILVEDRRLPMVTAALAVAGGSAALPPQDAGLASALAELLTDGTTSKSSKQVAEAAESYGGSISAEAAPDAVIVRTSALSDKADQMFALLSEVARSPSFPESEVSLRKANMKEELSVSRAESDFLSALAFYKKIFAGHPYAVTAPTDASIERITRARVTSAYQRLFVPRGAVLVLVGDLPVARAKEMALKNFGDWSGGKPPADAPPAQARAAERTLYLLDRPKSSQVAFTLGNLAAREDNPAYFDLLVVNGVLGGSFSSRLVQDVRESKGYTYRIGSRLDHRLTGSIFKIFTPVRTEVAGPALKAILDHLDNIRESAPKAEEVEQAKAFLSGGFARSLETQDGIARAVLHQKLQRLPADFYDTYVEHLQAVTPASAWRAAKTFMRPDEMVIVAVGDAGKLWDVLSAFSRKPIASVSIDGD